MLGLQCASNIDWISSVANNIAAVLCDHAHCEKKAATMAISLINRYPEKSELVMAMSRLAQEEMDHFSQVADQISQRGYTLTRDPGDSYVQSLHALIRKQEPGRFLDTLLVSSVIEARSCERFQLLAAHCTDLELRGFYGSLVESEAHHRTLFVRLARTYFKKEVVDNRLEELNSKERSIILALQSNPTMHG